MDLPASAASPAQSHPPPSLRSPESMDRAHSRTVLCCTAQSGRRHSLHTPVVVHSPPPGQDVPHRLALPVPPRHTLRACLEQYQPSLASSHAPQDSPATPAPHRQSLADTPPAIPGQPSHPPHAPYRLLADTRSPAAAPHTPPSHTPRGTPFLRSSLPPSSYKRSPPSLTVSPQMEPRSRPRPSPAKTPLAPEQKSNQSAVPAS